MSNKKLKIGIALLSVMAVALIWGMVKQFQKNNLHLKEIEKLSVQVERVEKKLENNQKNLNRLDILEYRNAVVKKKYPVFSKIVDVVYNKSKDYGFNPNLILSLIQIESNFRPQAVSSKGAYGLMQVNYSVWKKELDIDSGQIFDIEYNIDLGLRILKHYYKEANGDLLKTLHLYNNGYRYNNHRYKDKVVASVFY
jgi:soluble lytic murein transglycosylase-like protein